VLLEVVAPPPARTSLERHELKGRYTFRTGGIDDARGQYLGLLEAGDLIDAEHYARLIGALQRGTAAWAIAPTRRGSPPLSVRAFLQHGVTERCAYVVDRERLGSFTVSLPESAPAAEAVLFARLAAVFPPVFVAGPATSERAAERAPPPVAEALEAMKARPLRMLTTLEELIAHDPPMLHHAVADRVDAEMKKRAPRLHRALKDLLSK
jgi:hypothetical protein